MLGFMAVQYLNRLQKPERETVATRSASAGMEPQPVAFVSADIADAFDMRNLPGTVVVEAEPDRTAAATVSRNAVLKQLRTAGKVKSSFNRFAEGLNEELRVENEAGKVKSSFNRFAVLTFEPAAVHLTAFHSEVWNRQTMAADDITAADDAEPLAVCVPDAQLVKMLVKLKADRVRIIATIERETGEATIRLEADGGTFTMPADDADAFTTVYDGIDANGKPCNPREKRVVRDLEGLHTGEFAAAFATVVSAAELRESLTRTVYATDTESTRYALGGILFDQRTADRLTLAATDSRRLAVRHVSAETLGTFPEDDCDRMPFVVGSAALQLLADCLDRVPNGESVTIAGTRTEFVIKSDAFTLRGRNIEGRFPRYLDVIPRSGYNVCGTFDRKQLQTAIETASVVCDEESRGMDFSFNNGRLSLTASSAALGKAETSCVAETSSHGCRNRWDASICITFDPKYVVDYLKTSSADRVTFRIIDAETAGILCDEDDADGLCVIMPLHQARKRFLTSRVTMCDSGKIK